MYRRKIFSGKINKEDLPNRNNNKRLPPKMGKHTTVPEKIQKPPEQHPYKYDEALRTYFEGLEKITLGEDKITDFITQPLNLGICEMANVYKNDLAHLTSQKFNVIEEEYDLFTIIPFSKRILHLEKTLRSLLDSAKKSNKKIGFLVIENSIMSRAKELVNSLGEKVYYVWLNSESKIFNKCYCHNLGSYLTKSKYLHFHDCDILVPNNFYDSLLSRIDSTGVVQCFNKRRVNYLNEDYTKRMFGGVSLYYVLKDPNSFKEGVPGAPGGSIAISREIFELSGGFDPYFFWGYSSEDKFFWDKVEKSGYKILSLDSPPIEVYHMWHPPNYGINPRERFEGKIHSMLLKLSERETKNFISISHEIYLAIKKEVVVDDNIQ